VFEVEAITTKRGLAIISSAGQFECSSPNPPGFPRASNRAERDRATTLRGARFQMKTQARCEPVFALRWTLLD
jgi:hypothetical protein